ncbi:glycolipid synthase [Oceanococcus atlanticus]|uniref:Glycolipid synthase n=1 Tax=Oceanococcus atlanticus TaxID=1317117 RepID=A0A1Y1SES7_9GAMM|nr:type I polyketide synthase [Oceanococcus atlanticus]ORE87487.1 glycolipid synthase [Oceanococcus atlanticus]
MSADIAIIGMSGVYAGARDVPSFWNNIVNKVDAISEADEEWTGPYLDPASKANDRIYTNRGGFLKDLATFNPAEFGIMPNAIDGGEPDQYLALRLARDALADAGYMERDFDREKAGVVLGRGTYVNRGYTTLMQHGLVIDQTLDLLRQLRPDLGPQELAQLRSQLKDSAPPFTTEMAPGLVPNVVSGLICNRLNLMGPNYIIDAACASTLIATDVAMRDLAEGRADMMVTGGIQAHTPPQIYMIFCQLGALSRGALRPFDANAGGTLLGEGAGLVVLKRLADAERDGDKIYAVIRGYGASSDGRAKGLLAPRKEGEVLAIKRAYADAQIDPSTLGLVEAHGTGIALGDKTEIESLTEIFGRRSRLSPSIAIGSVKSMISHCIPAAGSASIIKTALALHHKVLPPTLCDEVNPALEIEKTPFYVNTETRPWIHTSAAPRRAGINSFGFGGVNAHLVLEEYRPADAVRFAAPMPKAQAPANVAQPALAGGTELLCFAAPSHAELLDQVTRAKASLDTLTPAQLAAQHSAAQGEHRLALVCSDKADLVKKLDTAVEKLAASDKPFKTRSGVHYGHGQPAGKVAVLFPGEGAQYPGMLSELAVAFPQVREWFDFLDTTVSAREYQPSEAVFPAPNSLSEDARRELEHKLFDMDLASESVFASSQGLWALMRACELKPDVLVGHSTGENTALVAAGAIAASTPQTLAGIAQGLNAIYRQLESESAIKTGSLLTVGGLAAESRDAVLAEFGDALVVAMDNCPNQAVVFGAPEVVAKAHSKLSAAGAICAELPFGRAYHTAGFEPVSKAFRTFYQDLPIAAPQIPVVSCASMQAFPDEPDAIRDLACSQWARPVRFRETVQSLYDDGFRVFLEVGPSANLTAFVGDILKGKRDVLALASNSRRQGAMKALHATLAALFAAGVPLKLSALYADRADARAPQPVKPGARPLSLAMPLISFKDVPPLPAPKVAADAPPQASTAAPVSAPQAAPPSDPRQQALQSHFALMQEFLASQQRVLAGAPQGAALAPSAPAVSAPAAPLITRVLNQDSASLQAQVDISGARDLYLQDHCIGAAPSRLQALRPLSVVPFTFSMEMAAEAAGLLAPAGWVCKALNNVRGHRWLALDHGSLSLKLTATCQHDDARLKRYAVRLLMAQQGKPDLPVFEAEVEYAAGFASAPQALEWQSEAAHAPRRNPPAELYQHGMFHGPRLQGVKALKRWGSRSVEAELEVLPTADYFADDAQPRFRIDPALLDAAGQLAGYWLTEKYDGGFNCFPFQIERYEQFAAMPAQGARVLCRGDIVEHDAPTFAAQWDLIDAQGGVIARASGWTDRKFELPQRYYRYRLDPLSNYLSAALPADDLPAGFVLRKMDYFADNLMGEAWGVWMRVLAHMLLDEVERNTFYQLPDKGPRREEWLMGRVAAKEAARLWIQREYQIDLANADIRIDNDAHGRPRVQCAALEGRVAPSISISHSGATAVAVAGDAQLGLGVDLQHADAVNSADVERGGLTDGERRLLENTSGAERGQRVVALWAAKEAVAKALGHGLKGRPQAFMVTQAVFSPRDGRPALAQVHYQGNDYSVQWLKADTGGALALASVFSMSQASSDAAIRSTGGVL